MASEITTFDQEEFGISVLMPVYNAGVYLADAVTSIVNQLGVVLELIIIDDHSTDDALTTLPQDPRIRLLKNPGHGIVAALNAGAQLARYPFLARMDADDIALPKRLITQLQYLLDNPDIDICGTRVDMFKDSGAIDQGYAHYQRWINTQCEHSQIVASLFVESPIPHPSAMLKKATLLNLGGYQDTTWPEDYDLWCRAFINGKRFGKPDTPPLLKWRDYEQRTSRVQTRYSKQAFLRCKAFYLSQYLHQRGVNDCEIWGCGPTGRNLHDHLENNGITTRRFVDVNPKMRGQQKRNKPVYVVKTSLTEQDLQSITSVIIVAVSTRGTRDVIREKLTQHGLVELRDFILAA